MFKRLEERTQNIGIASADSSPRRSHLPDLENIDELVGLYWPVVFRMVVLSVADRDIAESITQDCFLKAYAKRNQFRGECGVKTWLMRIALNLIRSHTRTEKFRFWKRAAAASVQAQDIARHLQHPQASMEQQAIASQQVDIVLRGLKLLSPKQRSVFLMRFVEDLELAEIAAATGMPITTVKTHLRRAIHAVREQMGRTDGPAAE